MARRTRTAALAIIAALGLLVAPATAGETDATFEVTGSSTLNISVPEGSVDFGEAAAGGSLGGELGTVTVSDSRANLLATWTAQVSATDFELDEEIEGGHPEEAVVSNDSVTYDAGTLDLISGSLTGDGLTAATPGPIGDGKVAATFVGIGSNQVSWSPDLTFNLQAAQVRGVYTGTVTHSVTAGLLD